MRGAVLAMAMLLAACGGGGEPPAATGEPEMAVDASWDGDTITVEADTDLPDGAVLSWAVFDEAEGEDGDMVRGDDLTVTDGTATGTVDVAGFDDDAEVEVSFVPAYKAQPDDVTELEPASATVQVSRG